MFSASAFVGSMVGNLVFGALTWVMFWILMLFAPSSVATVMEIISLRNGTIPTVFRNLFITSVGKNGGYWWMSLLFCLISFLLLFWAYKKYQTISLDNDGRYLLNQESRWPIWIFMTAFCSFILGTAIVSPWYSYYMNLSVGEAVSIWEPINGTLIILILTGIISYVLIFFSEIKEKIGQRKAFNRLGQKS